MRDSTPAAAGWTDGARCRGRIARVAAALPPGWCVKLFAMLTALGANASAQVREFRLPAAADTCISTVPPGGPDASGGGLDRLYSESNRRFVLLRFDVSVLRDMVVTKATLRVRRVEHLLVRAGVSTVSAEWGEGSLPEFKPEPGAACFRYAAWAQNQREAKWWGQPGSDISDVVFGAGGSRWVSVVPSFDKSSLWYEIDVPPALVQAMVQGFAPGGLCLADDFGRSGTFPTIWSRESTSPPELVVSAEPVAPRASAAPSSVEASRDDLGLEWVSFSAPAALGFQVYLSAKPPEETDDLAAARPVDIWALPSPGAGRLRALLSFTRQSTDRSVRVRVQEAGGGWSEAVSAALPPLVERVPVLPRVELPRLRLPEALEGAFVAPAGVPLSEDGRWIRCEPTTWFDPRTGPVALEAGRNEFVAFQVILAGGPGDYAVTLADWQPPGAGGPAPSAELYRVHYVRSRLGQEKYAPDALLPLKAGEVMSLALLPPTASRASQPARHARVQAVWVEVHIPRGVAPGVWKTRVIALRDGEVLLDAPLALTVVAAELPDALHFTAWLDTAATPAEACGAAADAPEAGAINEAFHRLAHVHRATLVVAPYASGGRTRKALAPQVTWEGDAPRLEWSEWEATFKRMLDGAAFRDLPRAAAALAALDLPFHEAWPLPFTPRRAAAGDRLAAKYHYRSTWTEVGPSRPTTPQPTDYLVWPIEAAFDQAYAERTRAALRAAAAGFAERAKGTTGYVALRNGGSAGPASSWWAFDGPQTVDDALAARFWLRLYREALGPRGQSALRLRATCAHPLFQRDLLDGLPDVTVISPALLTKSTTPATISDRLGDLWALPADVSPELGWASVDRWVWSAVLGGARGVFVGAALGSAASWEKSDNAAWVYPALPLQRGSPLPGVRLKALARAQQDMEWLERWVAAEQARGAPRGYALAIVCAALIERTRATIPQYTTLLPAVAFPGAVDTVAFEEVRRSLRAAARAAP